MPDPDATSPIVRLDADAMQIAVRLTALEWQLETILAATYKLTVAVGAQSLRDVNKFTKVMAEVHDMLNEFQTIKTKAAAQSVKIPVG